MADVTPNINQARAMRVAVKRIEGFAKQFGEAHRNLARHAAFPFVLTPDLLYQIWANFVPEAPWTAVAHVLLSRLCRQVGYEMYEMDIADRNLLLRELKEQFGQERLDELGEFLLDYVAQRLTEDDPDTQDLAQAHEWTALTYTQPTEVARELAQVLSERVKQEDMAEVFRLASLVETFAEPLVEAGFKPLLTYAYAMKSFVSGNHKDAAEQLDKLFKRADVVEIAGVNVNIPPELQPLHESESLSSELSKAPETVLEKAKQETSLTLHEIDNLVQEVRTKVRDLIQMQCGAMRVLGMSQPIGLNDIYTHVNILENITSRRRVKIADLLQEGTPENFERFGLGGVTERVSGIEAVKRYPKLMVLGKPGIGKTTFLKKVAIQCNVGNFLTDRVPIFITLKSFTENTHQPGLLRYISQQFSSCKVIATQVADIFKYGRALVLLDGLDEVRHEDSRRILKAIRDLSGQFSNNHFVISCRMAAREYIFEDFVEVEIADFDDEQIFTFATNWFRGEAIKAESFIKCLQEDNRIKELATNPLLLTLLCLVFQQLGQFPANRAELYHEGLTVLLQKWDAQRAIQRDKIYRDLPLKQKEDLLDQIALTTFERGNYFFRQKDLEQYIANYIHLLDNAKTAPEALQIDSQVVVKSIEAQHGVLIERAKSIYSFSHITFHEYFVSRAIVSRSEQLDLENLVSHVTELRWREIFLLVAGMLPKADHLLLLMKQQTDRLVATDKKLQQFLMWVREKSSSVEVPYKPAAIRVFYFSLGLDLRYSIALHDEFGFAPIAPHLVSALDHKFALVVERDLTLDITLKLAHAVDQANNHSFADLSTLTDACTLYNAFARQFNSKGEEALQQLKDQLPNPNQDSKKFEEWWKANSQVWTEQLRTVLIEYRNIGHD
jgi:predicted NACHT family NTPase